jgi:preprotein translocase subunit SecF
MLTSLVALGASATRWFGAALLVGAISGTYSSFAIAVPLVVYLKTKKQV